MAAELVAFGTWVYGGVEEAPVWVVRADFDFWHEIARADDTLEPGEQPALNESGSAYYVIFKPLDDEGRFWPDESIFHTLSEARVGAETKVPSPIKWRE